MKVHFGEQDSDGLPTALPGDSTNLGTVALSLAVLPKYRTECIRVIREYFGNRLVVLASSAHLDPSVKTGVPSEWYTRLPILRFGRIAFFQMGAVRRAIIADVVILDLNPRSINAVLILAVRKMLRRPSIVWGHIHPQAGAGSRTAVLRRMMRRLADSTISYTYRDQEKARRDLHGQPVFVAPNALYAFEEMHSGTCSPTDRNIALYVGRLEPEKKVHLILEAAVQVHLNYPNLRIRIIGKGSQEEYLKQLSARLGLINVVQFDGWIDDVTTLREIYSHAFCSLSPGFAGLGLTQSLGFGVPMLIARKEPHSPEIELSGTGGVTWFESDSPSSLADALKAAWEKRSLLPTQHLSEMVRNKYSAEAMGAGLIDAVEQTLATWKEAHSHSDSRSVIPIPARKLVRAALRRAAVRGPVTYGQGFRVGLGTRVHSTHGLTIGSDVAIGPGSAVQINGSIGNFVMIGMNVQIVGKNDHAYDEPGRPMLKSTWVGDRSLDDRDLLVIGDDVWIGASSVILSGIILGEGSIVAAGSVVTKDVEPYSVVAGSPAKKVKSRFTSDADKQVHEQYLSAQRNMQPK